MGCPVQHHDELGRLDPRRALPVLPLGALGGLAQLGEKFLASSFRSGPAAAQREAEHRISSAIWFCHRDIGDELLELRLRPPQTSSSDDNGWLFRRYREDIFGRKKWGRVGWCER